MRIENARRDSARAAALAGVLRLQDQIVDSIAAGREALRTLDVRLQGDLTDVQRQLLQVQELTGQSQQRLSEMKARLPRARDRPGQTQQRLSKMKAQLDPRAEMIAAASGAVPGPPPAAPGDTG